MMDTTRDFYTQLVLEVTEELDEVDLSNTIAFTWAPDPSKYASTQPRKQYKALLSHILLSSFKYFDKFCFIPELTQAGNVHIHGWFILKDKIKYFKHFLPRCREFGFVYCKPMDSISWGKDYMTKDIETSIAVIGEDLPIPLTHLNVKAYADIYISKFQIKRKPQKTDIVKLFKKYYKK